MPTTFCNYLDSRELGIKHLNQRGLNEAAGTKLPCTITPFAIIILEFFISMVTTILVESVSYCWNMLMYVRLKKLISIKNES